VTFVPRRHRLTCDGVLRRLDDYTDRALSAAEISRVEAHLSDCLACARAARFEATLVDGIRQRLRRIAVPPGLLAAVSARLRTEFRDGGLGPLPGGS
jgi:anti-sigma factor (TIGR02949 family)